MKRYLTIGLMSGTSMDGIDAALLETNGIDYVKTEGALTHGYTPPMQVLLKSLEYAVKKTEGDLFLAKKNFKPLFTQYLQQEINNEDVAEKICQLEVYIKKFNLSKIDFPSIERLFTHLHYQLIKKLLIKYNIKNNEIDLIGFHGQTLYHNPSKKISIQIGDGDLLANLTNIQVVNDFRKNDIIHGGQGAPFAPLYHQALAKTDDLMPAAVVNIGGIANLTLLLGDKSNEILAYDVGPGNGLLDRFVRKKTQLEKLMDEDGTFASLGYVNEEVLRKLFEKSCMFDEKNFFELKPPKSLDINDLQLIPELMALNINDGCRTLVEFTVKAIIDSFKFFDHRALKYFIVAGGGSHHPVMMAVIKKYAHAFLGQDIQVKTANEVSWNNDTLEAEIFAYLAVRAIKKLPLSLPNTTNVPYPLSGGHIINP